MQMQLVQPTGCISLWICLSIVRLHAKCYSLPYGFSVLGVFFIALKTRTLFLTATKKKMSKEKYLTKNLKAKRQKNH